MEDAYLASVVRYVEGGGEPVKVSMALTSGVVVTGFVQPAAFFASISRQQAQEQYVSETIRRDRGMEQRRWPAASCGRLRSVPAFDLGPLKGKVRLVKELPDDLAALPVTELSEQRAIRDDRLARLFKRWPALSRPELSQLRRIYAERLRIAKYLGRSRVRG